MVENTPQKESHWFRNLMIIIIIGLLVWQYIIPYIAPDFATPSDYILNDNLRKTFKVILIDEITGYKTNMLLPTGADNNFYARLVYAHTYHLIVQSNLQAYIFGEFTVLMDMRYLDENQTLQPPADFFHYGVKVPGYTPLITSTISASAGNFEINYNYDLMRIDFIMYNQNGLRLKYETSNTTEPIHIFLEGYAIVYPTPGVIYNI